MNQTVAVLIDGGHLRCYARNAKTQYAPDLIERIAFSNSDKLLHDLSQRDLFAIRTGVLKFRGFALKKSRVPFTPNGPLTDDDFEAKFEQKGVDMRIGLDMATLSSTRAVHVIALMTNDTDCVPAMKHARRSGLQVALIVLPGQKPAPELLTHSDFRRDIPWSAPRKRQNSIESDTKHC